MPSPTNVSACAFKINGTSVADMASASVNLTRQQIDVTSLGSTARIHEQGMLEGTVQIEMFFDASHSSVLSGIGAGTVLTQAEVAWASGNYIKGDAFVQDFSLSVAPNNVAMATATLIFSKVVNGITYA